MRLGKRVCLLKENTKAYKAYGQNQIEERHRHRYKFNNEFKKLLEDNGLIFSAHSKDDNLIEIVELPKHPWFVAVQFHPEFKSRPQNPHPLFSSFVAACIDAQKN